jgi:large subunit ribosomal protein L24
MKTFSAGWKGSKQPRKQRKYIAKAPLNLRRKMISSCLSKELRAKHSKRNIAVRKGDKVMVMRGEFKKRSGTVEKVDIRQMSVYVSGTEFTKRDGTKARVTIDASNLMITELNLSDKKRKEMLEQKK